MIITFIVFSLINVIIQTVRSIVTIKCNKWIAAIVNAIAYGVYTYVIVLTASDIDLWIKIIVTASVNLVGVFIVKWIEEKKKVDRLWCVKFTVDKEETESIVTLLKSLNISNYYNIVGKHTVFDTFCNTQKETVKIKEIIKLYEAKYFISENRSIL